MTASWNTTTYTGRVDTGALESYERLVHCAKGPGEASVLTAVTVTQWRISKGTDRGTRTRAENRTYMGAKLVPAYLKDGMRWTKMNYKRYILYVRVRYGIQTEKLNTNEWYYSKRLKVLTNTTWNAHYWQTGSIETQYKKWMKIDAKDENTV